MTGLGHHDTIVFFLALAVLLGTARIAGELMHRIHQPAVVGELLAGILLGPTVFGTIAPRAHTWLFPEVGAFPVALDALTSVAIVLFLVVAGFEVDLSAIWRQGTSALSVSAFGMLVPFVLAFVVAWFIPEALHKSTETDRLVFALFFATALCISALPVIAKVLMDLGLFRSDVGMVVIAAAIINDLAGWMIFAFLLSILETDQDQLSLATTLVMLCLFAGTLLTIGRRILDRALAWVQAHTSWPGGVLGFILSGALLCAAFTEWLGIHAIFGGFLFGVALGDSRHLRGRTRRTLEQFISYVFAPIFFASIGLQVNFAANFDLILVAVVLVLATLGKVGGCWAGARLSGMGKRESWAVGFAMNARGAMEIILGLLALEVGLIGETMFVALVIMALLTSMGGGIAMRYILGLQKPRRFFDYMPAKGFVARIQAASSREAIFELAEAVAPAVEMSPQAIGTEVWLRESIMSTNLGNGVAIPHARIPRLKAPVVAVGFSRDGVDFDSPEDRARILCLVLTPSEAPDSQVQILADIARTFQRADVMEKTLRANTSTEFFAYLRTTDSGR